MAITSLKSHPTAREILSGAVGSAQGDRRVLATGLTTLDRLLPRGGIPIGQITQLIGGRGSGRTAMALLLASQMTERGERVAFVDLEGDLDPQALHQAELPPELIWVVRPARVEEALWAADLLLRSGHFRLVVVDGLSSSLKTSWLVRLQRQARESEAVLVLGAERWPVKAPGSLHLECRPLRIDWAPGLTAACEPCGLDVAIRVGKGRGETTVRFPCRPRRLLGRHPLVADRRPAKWTEGERLYAVAWSRRKGPKRRPPPEATHLADEVFGGTGLLGAPCASLSSSSPSSSSGPIGSTAVL